jgi:hypothetical protein
VLSVIAPAIAAAFLSVSAAAGAEPKPFEITRFEMHPTAATNLIGFEKSKFELAGIENVPYAFTQAGGRPWALTTTIEFASEKIKRTGGVEGGTPTRNPKDVVVDLPPGLLGDPMAVPRCSLAFVISRNGEEHCPADTQVGVFIFHDNGGKIAIEPIVNVTPEAGQSAEFAFENTNPVDTPILTGHLVRTPEGYGFNITSNEIPLISVEKVETTFWGDPGDSSHDPLRGLECGNSEPGRSLECQRVGGEQFAYAPNVPFLTMPADCAAGPETATVRADSWEEPGRYVEATTTMPAASGCNLLGFQPQLEVQPDEKLTDEPVGLGVNLSVPLSETPGALGTPQLRDTTLTLPQGLSVSPSVVDGIRACEATGPEGINIEGPESERPGPNGELQLAPGHCPDASKVGTAEAITPFLPEPVKGSIYLAKPGCGGPGEHPCTEQDALDGNLYKLYLELGGEGALLGKTGVHFKVPMETSANPSTGQLTTRVLDTPQAPFSELKVHLNGGPRAPLDNPATCGAAQTSADLTPWSAPGTTPEGIFTAGTPDATPSSFFNVEGCQSPEPFSPGFTAGTVTPQAGEFSSFTLNLTRRDREQYIKGIQVHTPAGLLGMVSAVQQCGEADANAGTCPASSKIGTVRVASGAGSHPFEIEGNVYLTGPYDGSPFGLSIVTHAVAGPFNLGLVVVRARIAVDPVDSTLTITADESGPHALPQIVFGVPLRLQRITVNIDRPGFMLNPTDCNALQVSARVSGSGQSVADLASPFAVGGCRSLAFTPSFTVSTGAHTSKLNGASLDSRLTYPAYKPGSEANVAYVKVQLPKQLPSRLTTLQKACLASVFEANPASCPPQSVVGAVRATTPVLPAPLTGPVYFVSHGGEAFPSLIVVLQGDGVRVNLTGSTFISATGITSTTFRTVPDVPVESFELYLPQGPFSALAANTNLCKVKGGLHMPTEFVAQNGAVLRRSTPIRVTGCGKAKASRARRARHARVHHARRRRSDR